MNDDRDRAPRRGPLPLRARRRPPCRPAAGRPATAATPASTCAEEGHAFGPDLYEALEATRACPRPRCSPASAAGTRPRSPTFTRARRVLDLGSGGGIDVLLSAKRVGPTGKVYGLDMTEEMLALAIRNRDEAGRDQRRVPEGLHRGDPAPREHGRRRHLQLRHQPVDRQAARVRRDAPSAATGGRHRDRRRRGRRRAHPDAARRAGDLRRLHRRRAVVRRVRGTASRRPGSRTSASPRPTSPMPGIHSAIVKATKRIEPDGGHDGRRAP